MASKTNNITLPDGSTIAVPAWASESTMDQVVNYMAATNKVDQKFLTLMKGLGADVTGLQRSISSLVVGVNENTDASKNASKNNLDVAAGIKGAARGIMKASSFFGNTEKPISSMVDATSSLVSSFKTLDPEFLGKIIPAGGKLSKSLDKFGGVADVAADAILAYAGWNAAKFEQFADAQKKAIDAGAIFYSSGEQFDLLYSNSIDAGVTYNAMLDTIGNFGGTMTALGGNVSAGTVNFVDMFDNLNVMANDFGDLGLSSKDMMNQYAEYIESSRLIGQLDNATANRGEKLNNSFIKLQIESEGLASLTSLSKSEAMRRQLAAISEPLSALGISTLQDKGLPGNAEVARGIISTLGLIAPDAPVFQKVLDAVSQELAETSQDISQFNLGRRFVDDPGLRSAIEAGMPGFIDNINGLVQAGNVSAETAGDIILKSFAAYDQTRRVSAGAQAGSALKYILEFQTSSRQMNLNMGSWIDMSIEEREAYLKDMAGKMDTSGQAVETINDSVTTFLQLQDTMTLPMNETAEVFSDITGALKSGASRIQEFFGTAPADNGFGNYTNNGTTADGSLYSSGNQPLGRYDTSGAFTLTPLTTESGVSEFSQDPNNTPNTDTSAAVPPAPATLSTEKSAAGPTIENNTTQQTTIQQVSGTLEMGQPVGPITFNGTIVNPTDANYGEASRALIESKRPISAADGTPRKNGGPVTKGQPYIVGDQLGITNAELFVPETNGQIINNDNLKTMINNISNTDLTTQSSDSIINNLQDEYDSLIQSKIHTIATMNSLVEAVKLFNSSVNRKSKIDLTNSA